LRHQKHLFSIPEEITYLNTAAQSPLFKAIEKAGIEGIRQKSHAYKITIADYFEPVEELKKLFSQLIDADDYNRIAMIPSASYGLSSVANNISLKPKDEILIIEEQFPSNVYVWQKLADKYNATIKTVESSKSDSNIPKGLNENILNAINDNTAVIAIGHIHWSNGNKFDLKAISNKAKQYDALLIIDGSQSIGALPFSVKDIQPDALICAGYKWLFGPYGCAYGYFGSYFDNGNPIEENWSNRLDSENFTGLTNYESEYKPLANRYSVGEHGNFIYVKMQIEALKQIIEWTPEAIQEYCRGISEDAVLELQKLGCEIEDANFRSHHLFGIKLPDNLNIDAFKSELQKQNIFLSFRGSYIRISCHLFNTKEDFKKLVSCIFSVLNKN
jgi:selenocysteine lyase/cysteine desulfurase